MNGRLLIGLATAFIVSLAGCSSRTEPGNEAKADGTSEKSPAMGNQFALKSISVSLPTDDTEVFPEGPNVDLMNSDCKACHSPAMVLNQPPLPHDGWVKVVDKMRGTYKATVADDDVPKILAYLDDFSARQKQAAIPKPADKKSAM